MASPTPFHAIKSQYDCQFNQPLTVGREELSSMRAHLRAQGPLLPQPALDWVRDRLVLLYLYYLPSLDNILYNILKKNDYF